MPDCCNGDLPGVCVWVREREGGREEDCEKRGGDRNTERERGQKESSESVSSRFPLPVSVSVCVCVRLCLCRCRCVSGATALHWAAYFNETEAVKVLLWYLTIINNYLILTIII